MTILRDEILNIMIAGRDTVRNDYTRARYRVLTHRIRTDSNYAHFCDVLSRHAP